MSDNAKIVAELARVKAVFQLRAIEAAMGWPAKTEPTPTDAPHKPR